VCLGLVLEKHASVHTAIPSELALKKQSFSRLGPSFARNLRNLSLFLQLSGIARLGPLCVRQ